MSVGPTDGVGSVNSTSWDEPTYPPGLIDEFSGHINNSLRSAPTDTTKLPHYAFNEHSSTQMDAGGPAKDVKLPPPTDMVPLGGRLLRGARGGPILMLMQATRYVEFRVDGVEGRPDLSARHIQDGLDGFWGSDRLDIFDASKRQLTSLPLEKADKGSNIKDADGRIVGHLGLTQDDPPKIMAKISPEVLKQFPLPPTTGEAPKSDTVGADPTVKPDASPKAPTEQQSYGFVTKTQEEADLVTSMMALGKSQNEIQVALDDLRSKKGTGVSSTESNGTGTIDETERPFSEDERRIALVLRNEGKYVKAKKDSNVGRHGDAEVDGKRTEFKTMKPRQDKPVSDSATAKNQVNDSARRGGQARRMILDGRGSGLTEAEAIRGLNRITGITRGVIESVRIIGDGFDITREYQ